MDNNYRVKKLENIGEIKVQAPGSKSITNRALLLAAISGEKCRLRGVLFSDDSRAFLESLIGLGFQAWGDFQGRFPSLLLKTWKNPRWFREPTEWEPN